MKIQHPVVVLLISLLVGSCANSPINEIQGTSTVQSSPREAQDWLSDQHAQLRKQQVSDVSYQLAFDLTQTDQFHGETSLTFTNHLLTDDLTIDFSHGKVKQVVVNGNNIAVSYNDYFITVPKSALKSGHNVIKIVYSHAYSDNGSGLYRYQDHSDNTTYLYTHFEPYQANKLFPSFDQPNLRARYTVTVKAPAQWTVITSVKEQQVTEQDGVKLWHFPQSALFSTYIFPLHAGDYHVWQDHFEDIPLRLFSRQSVAQYIDSELWFDVTKKGLAFYNDYFDYRYPFGKYDQLVVPDFNISGMENVGAVTYTESVVSRGELTQAQRERIFGLLLHEMSHMWFGDLVTVDWWSNLWLKESFATYMSNVALGATGLSDNAWNLFYTNVKRAAYSADAQVTTHPIQMAVNDTKNGVASFDRITYEKGASVLNQLVHNLGEAPFKAGIRQYFKTYQYQATKLPDFMDTLSKVADQDLSQWTEDWLYKAGTNRIQVHFECQNNKVSTFRIEQSYPADQPYLREHALNIGLYQLGAKFSQIGSQAVKISARNTSISALVGSPCPDMVYPNQQDWGFVKVLLDNKTRNNVVRAIGLIEDPMLRAMFYQSLWDLVDDRQMALTEYIDLVMSTVQAEQDQKVLKMVLVQLGMSLNYLNSFSDKDYPAKTAYLEQIEQFMWQGLAQQLASSDGQQFWFTAAIHVTQTTEGLKRLADLLAGKNRIKGLALDQDRRWEILIQLASFGYPEVELLLTEEKINDPSYNGELSLIAADAAMPILANKQRWIGEFEKTDQRLTAKKQKTAMDYLFPSHQLALMAAVADRLIADLIAFDVDRDQSLVSTMVRSVTPRLCNQASVVRLQQAISANPQLGLIALKGLQQALQADQRCVALSKIH